jgi:dTDP-4-dehydrorhamnose reductase
MYASTRNTHQQGGRRVDRVLIAGIESVIGANLAACLVDRHEVHGLSLSGSVPLAACETSICRPLDIDAVRGYIGRLRPTWICFCGAGGDSTWATTLTRTVIESLPESARIWAGAAREFNCRLAWITSDAIFSGPWLFHGEDCSGHCPSLEARSLRAAEETVIRTHPSALVIRTHAYGWSPSSIGPGWIERLLTGLEAGTAGPFDSSRHAAPILASDLAEILEQACRAELSGVFHVAGSERTNPAKFIERLADTFDLPTPRTAPAASLSERPIGFGCGETSLRTAKIRHSLGVSTPLLCDGLSRLRAQRAGEYCNLLSRAGHALREKVA